MTEFISRNYGKEGYEIIIKTDSHEHYKAAESFARRLIDHSKPMTNAQKIRAMSDEELAWELMLWRCEAVARHHGISSVYPDTQKTILEWLQQPCGEEDKHEDY